MIDAYVFVPFELQRNSSTDAIFCSETDLGDIQRSNFAHGGNERGSANISSWLEWHTDAILAGVGYIHVQFVPFAIPPCDST